jgi:DNA-binding response OmpR family regulator
MLQTKILYVEDEHFLGKIVKESLETRGYQVTMIGDGRQVIQAFKNFAPDICILDIMLPGKDGLSLAREIRILDPAVPLIFLTAKTQTEDLVSGFKAGGNDYVRKPFSMEELIVRIENLLRLQQNPDRLHVSGSFQIGSFTYFPDLLELKGSGEITKLSHKENELLKLLVQNTHESIDRNRILQSIWGDDHFFNSRNLDVYITRLRRYFKSDPQVQIITLKGVGYRFVC